MVRKTLHALLLFLALYATWYVLSGVDTVMHYTLGAISCGLALLMAIRMRIVDKEGHPFHLAVHAPMYWMWLLKEMVKSGWSVARVVWSPELRISPKFAWLPIHQRSDLGCSIFANSLTLTPGTVCVDIEHGRVFIHALEKISIDELTQGDMDRRVARLAGATQTDERQERAEGP